MADGAISLIHSRRTSGTHSRISHSLHLHFCRCLSFRQRPLLPSIPELIGRKLQKFKADLPGLKKKEVKVEVEDDRVVRISVERKIEKEDKNDTWHHVERSSGKFLRSFKLLENAKMDQIKAAMENDVLTFTIPKVEAKKPDLKAIEISG